MNVFLKIRTIHYWVLIYLCFIHNVDGQSQLDTLFVKTEQIGVEQGLSVGYVYEIEKDPKGFMWFSTMQGLNRYDGYQVKEYTNIPGDSTSLPTNRIQGVLIDNLGRLWCRHMEGISLFDYESETFINLELPYSQEMIQGPGDEIWILQNNYNWSAITVERNQSTGQLKNNKLKIDVALLGQKYKGLPQKLRMTSYDISVDNHLYYINHDTLYNYQLDTVNQKAVLRSVNHLPSNESLKRNRLISHFQTGQTWYFGKNKCIPLDSEKGITHVNYTFPEALINNPLIPTTAMSDGNFLLGDSERNFYQFNPLSQQCQILIDSFDKKSKLAKGLSPKGVFYDEQQIIWCNSPGYGVFKYDLKSRKFHSPPFPKSSINELHHLHDNTILINSAEMVCFDGENITSCISEGIEYDHIYYTSQSENGDIDNNFIEVRYAKNGEESIFIRQMDAQGNTLRYWNNDAVAINPWEYIGHRYFSFNDGSLGLIARSIKNDREIKVFKWDFLNKNRVEHFIYPNQELTTFITEFNIPYQTDDGLLWIPSNANGLFCLNLETQDWKRYYKGQQGTFSILSDQIMSIREDVEFPDSILWVCTGSGLHKLNRQENTFEVFTKEDGLPNNVVYKALPDHNNRLWLSTNNGICRFDPKTKATINFTTADGLNHNEFNKNAGVVGNDGIMYFGGIGGVNYFDPRDFDQDSIDIPLQFTAIKINNELVDHRANINSPELAGLLQKPIEYKEELIIDNRHKMIFFEFALMDFSKSTENQFVYKLEGFNKKWTESKTTNQATFTNLPAGDYTLKVKAKNHEDLWSVYTADLKITVLPPFWDTWWFKLSMLSLFILSVYSLFKYRIRQNKKLEDLRNRISRDLHDEIGSTLSSISLFGTVANKMINSDQEGTRNMLDRINDSTTQVMESMNDIVWAINSENDKINDLVMRMRAYISELSDASEIRITLDIDEVLKKSTLDMVQKRNIYLIFKEALNNAFKYSNPSLIKVSLKQVKQEYYLRIQDDGCGFDLGSKDNGNFLGGNGLKNMKKRAEELGGDLNIQSKLEFGTSIQFKWNP